MRKRISTECSFHSMNYETRVVFYIPSPEARYKLNGMVLCSLNSVILLLHRNKDINDDALYPFSPWSMFMPHCGSDEAGYNLLLDKYEIDK